MNFALGFSSVLRRWPKIPPMDLQRMEHHCKGLTEREYEKLCDLILDSSDFAPSVPLVIKCIAQIKSQRPKLDVVKETFNCRHCLGSGYVNKWANVSGRWYEYAFGCPDNGCLAAATHIPPNYTRWSAHLSRAYYDAVPEDGGPQGVA